MLRRLRDPSIYDELEATGAQLEAGLSRFGRVQCVGAMLTLFCRDEPLSDFDGAKASDTVRDGEVFRGTLERGVYLAPSQFECLFVSLAHGDEEIERTVRAAGDVLGD